MTKDKYFDEVDQHDGRIDARGWSSPVGNENGSQKVEKMKKKAWL